MAETMLEMARRHVADGERIIAAQHRLITELRAFGASVAKAEDLLILFETTQSIFLADLAELEARSSN